MEQSSEKNIDPLSRLQQEIVDRIVDLVHEDALSLGARLNEHQISQRLGVSRTPIRHALNHLAISGFVERQHNRGMALIAMPPRPRRTPGVNEAENLIIRIAHDRGNNRLPVDFSETELMRLYDLDRQQVRTALEQLADLDVVERKPGYGWRFLDTLYDANSRTESYRYRMVIEVAALLEPAFVLDRAWAKKMRHQHEATLADALAGNWHPASSIEFFEMNAVFHEGLGEASGNRFLAKAIRLQNRLRRLSNYDWTHGIERVVVNCRQHLEILDRLEAGECDIAAALMRRHLEIAMNLPTPLRANPSMISEN